MKDQKKKTNKKTEKPFAEKSNAWGRWKKLVQKKWFPFLIILAVTLVAYANSFDVPFQFDDDVQIVYRTSSHSLEKFSDFDYWLNVNNRPVSSFTLTANYLVNGEKVAVYHVVNLIIHLLTGIFLFLLLRIVLSGNKNGLFKYLLPLVVTLFFLVNPVQTQSVTYIVQRMTSMAGMFFMLGILLYVLARKRHLNGGRAWQSGLLLFLSLAAGLLGTYSKQNAAVFPLAYLLAELFFIRNKNGKICKKYVFSMLGAGAVVGIFFLLKYGLPVETTEISRADYFATQLFVIPRYIQMMLVPVGLCIDHGVKAAESFGDSRALFGGLFLLGLTALSFFWIKKRPFFSFGVFFMFIAFIVESSVLPIRDVMFDHRMYLPLAGLSIAVWSLLFDCFAEKKPALLSVIVVVVLLGMAAGTFARNQLWRDRVKIWEQVTQRYPEHARGWLGYARMAKGGDERYDQKAFRAFQKYNQLQPGDEEVLLDLGLYSMKTGHIGQGLEAYGELLDSENDEYRLLAQRTYAAYHINKENWDEAITYLNEILKDYPDDENALISLPGVYIRMKDFKNASETARVLLEKYPGNRKGLFYYGKALFFLEERQEAKIQLEKLLQIEPNNVEALVMHGNACINTHHFDEAIKSFQKAHEITNDPQMLQLIEFVNKVKESY
ncbi:MAG: tetratricopeptide repeat protein [Prolixibacteraceae bacterium]|nr:tetratricopeptide repeat protein [Prolixibacteraceae bacterium]